MGKDIAATFLLIILFVVVVFIIFQGCEADKMYAICVSHGFTTGDWDFRGKTCTQELTCTLDEVMSGICKPIDIGK